MKSQCVSMVVPPPIAAPWTAATSGLSRLTSASISRACGDSPGPGGFLRKSSISLPAQNESPAPCQRTTRVFSSFAASLKMVARATYMADVIAFRFVGRFNWTRRMLPACSVTISSIVDVPSRNFTASRGRGGSRRPDCVVVLNRMFLCFRNGTARTQTIDFGRAKSELPENFVVVFSNLRGALRGHLGDTMHLKRAADCGRQLAAGTIERNDDVVRLELGIIDHLLRSTHCSERHVSAVEHLVPMRHRLGTEDLVKDRRELRHIRHQLRRIGETRIGQKIRAADGLGDGCRFVGRDNKNEPGVILGTIDVQRRIRWILAIVLPKEFSIAQRGLDRDARGPYAFGKKRGRDMRPLARALATIKGSDDRRIEPDGGGIVAAAGDRPGRRRTGIACHRQQSAACPVRRDVKAGEIRIGSLVAVTRDVRVDQTRIPPHYVLIFKLQFRTRRMRRVDDENIGPFDELFEDLLGAWRLQIKRHTPLVAIGEMPGVSILGDRLWRELVPNPPEIAARRLHFDDVGAEVRQDHRGAGACDEARKIYHL